MADNHLQTNLGERGPDYSKAAISNYFATRLPTLIPKNISQHSENINPIPALRSLNRKQWLFFLVAFCGWTWDAFDFFSVSITAPDIAESLNVSVKDITWGITLVLMLRSVGAVIFGVAADRYGRKWPFIFNCALFIVLELGTGFVKTYKEFLGVRSLFGIAMGGIYGNCAATALEDCPHKARGIISGLLQQGYAFGYLLTVVFNRAITDTSPHGWRALFWFGACPPVLIIIFRMCLPETEGYQLQKDLEKTAVEREFINQAKVAWKTHYLTFIYLVIFMAGMNFMSHGSQDLYPTMLSKELNFSEDRSTVTNSVANLGALAGGTIIGHLSETFGRRLSVMFCCVLGGALIYPWAFTRNNGINAGVFFLQFFVQGAWGVVPIHVSELSPPRFRAFIVGTAYQLGNLASSASSTIEATIGERFPLYDAEGKKKAGVYNYSKVMAIFMGCVFAYVLIVTFLGPENRDGNLLTHEDDEHIARAHEKLHDHDDPIEKPHADYDEGAPPPPRTAEQTEQKVHQTV